jgi:hypothetical protein
MENENMKKRAIPLRGDHVHKSATSIKKMRKYDTLDDVDGRESANERANESASESEVDKGGENDGSVETAVLPRDIGSRKLKPYVMKKMKQTVGGMICSTDMYMSGSYAALWERFEADGYLLLRNLLNRDEVLNAREDIESSLVGMKYLSTDRARAESKVGWTVDTLTGTIIAGQDDFANDRGSCGDNNWLKLCKSKSLRRLLDKKQVTEVVDALAVGRSLKTNTSFDNKLYHPEHTWLRVKAAGEYTPEHADIFYFKVNFQI